MLDELSHKGSLPRHTNFNILSENIPILKKKVVIVLLYMLDNYVLYLFDSFCSLPADFGNIRPSQPGRGLPVRSGSLDMNVSPQQPSLQYPIRATSPYTVMQQQQQGMVGNHTMMANQAGMVNTGEGDGHNHCMFSDRQCKSYTTYNLLHLCF